MLIILMYVSYYETYMIFFFFSILSLSIGMVRFPMRINTLLMSQTVFVPSQLICINTYIKYISEKSHKKIVNYV